MAFIKCIDCGKIYNMDLEACPQCGCPTEHQQQPPMFNGVDCTQIDVTNIFNIKKDKFEETKDIFIYPRKIRSCSIFDLCESLQVAPPSLYPYYHIEKGFGQILIHYSEFELLEKIDNIDDEELADKFDSPCKRMIINIDDRENIRLDLENNESIWGARFPITQELFLKCCNAKKLEFKITKENGESVIVNGYYSFDPETGVEIDVNGDVVIENDTILNFQALYNYVIDKNMFKDALGRRKMLDEWYDKQAELIRLKRSEDEKREGAGERIEETKPSKLGKGYLISGFILLFLGIILFAVIDIKNVLFFFLPPSVLVVGIILLIYGFMMRRGYSSNEVTTLLESFLKK